MKYTEQQKIEAGKIVAKILNQKQGNETKINAFKKSRKIISLVNWNRCNLCCPYCVSSMHIPGVQKAINILDEIGYVEFGKKLQILIDYFKSDGSLVHIVFGSGEYTMYEGWEYLFDIAYKNNCTIGMQSNMQTAEQTALIYDKYPAEWIANNVGYNASYHLGTYLLRPNSQENRDRYVNTLIKIIADRKIQTNLIVPLSPQVLADDQFESEIEKIKNYYKDYPKKFTVHFVELVHILNGKKYPDSFTDAERNRLYELMSKHNSTRPLSGDKKDLEYGERFYVKGVRCWLPSRIIQVTQNGDLLSCEYSKEGIAGNIKNIETLGSFLKADYINCPFDVCGCTSAGRTYAFNLCDITLDEYISLFKKILANQ